MLLHMIGKVAFNTTSTYLSAPLPVRKGKNHAWRKSKLSAVWKNGSAPKVIIADRELALIAAIAQVLPESSNLLCIRHINKNIDANCKMLYTAQENLDEFL